MQKLRAPFAAGSTVGVRGEPWRVARSETFERCTLVTLRGTGPANHGETLRVISPFDRIRVKRSDGRLRRASANAAARRAAEAFGEAHPPFGLWTAGRASIDLLPWQLEPALAVVAGATRVLLADAVGLGKTIQAGLVLAELFARGLSERALVLTPPGLRAQWRGELANRFGIDAAEVDHAALSALCCAQPVGVNAWASAAVVISSIDLLKRPEHLSAVSGIPIDVLVVDEAHHLTPGTDRGAAVARLASACPWVILLTATPHSGDEGAYRFLESIGSIGADRLTIFRRSALEVARPVRRRSRLCAVATSAAEAAMLRATGAYADAIWRGRGVDDHAAQLVAIVLARRAASSAAALLKTLQRRLLLMTGEAEPKQTPLPWDEWDERDDVEADALLRVPGLHDPAEERARLEELLELARSACANPSKPAWIRRLLGRTREPAIVFSEYRDTIEDLALRLSGEQVAVLHGGSRAAERRAAVEAFVGGSRRVLLATDAAGEGLNLQARCRLVVNAELPWNPVRLEQRAGRVDRLGQRRTVHALHLIHRGSIEDRVLAVLHRRIARGSLGGGCAAVMGSAAVQAVAAAALGGGPAPDVRTLAASTARVPNAREEAARIAMVRRVQRITGAHVPQRASTRRANAALIAMPRHSSMPVQALLCLFESIALTDLDQQAGRYLFAARIDLDPPIRVSRQSACNAFAKLARHPRVQELATNAAHAALEHDRSAAADASRAMLSRFTALIEAARRSAPRLFQDSLFDGRAARAAERDREQLAASIAHLERRRAFSAALASLHLGDVRLVAVWPLGNTRGELARRGAVPTSRCGSTPPFGPSGQTLIASPRV